jgi:hypothetical protein
MHFVTEILKFLQKLCNRNENFLEKVAPLPYDNCKSYFEKGSRIDGENI